MLKKFDTKKFLIKLSVIILIISLIISIFIYIITHFKKVQHNIKDNIDKIIEPQKNNVIIGIDLGLKQTGYYVMFASPLNYKKYDFIYSQILLDRLNKIGLAIGQTAYERFIFDKKNKDNYLYISSFKNIFENKINEYKIESDYPGYEIHLRIILKEFLRLLKDNIEEYYKEIFRDYNNKEIKWIICIPPLWDNNVKKIIKDAALKAGMINLEVILKQEAISLSLFNEDNIILKNKTKNNITFLLVNIEENIVEFSANRILDDNNLEQLMFPISILNGSSIINNKIFDIFKKFIGEEKIKNKDYIIKPILYKIEDTLENIDSINTNKIKFDIKLFDIKCKGEGFFDSIMNKIYNISSDYCEKEIEGINLFYTNEDLFIPVKYIHEIISKFIMTIINKINHILSRIDSIDLIAFTGDFINIKIFREKIEEYKKGHNSKIVFMEEPQITVIKGAALFGLSQIKISKSIIPITIGIDSYEKKKPNEICDEEYFYKEINEYRCHKYLTFVKKKESIEIDKIINHRINIINERISIYYSYENEITNKNKIILGFVEPNESEIPLNNRKLNITMNFNNYIHVTLIDEDSGFQVTTFFPFPLDKLY